MTPEQIEAYKAYAQINRGLSPEMAVELLTTLEEAEKKADLAYAAYEGLQGYCVSHGEYDSLLNKHSVLARAHREAQQTIARQRENERAFLQEVSEIHMEAYAGSNGSLDRADTALKRIMLLSSNIMALGNKEGEKTI